ncbi:MAG: exodeoxyribonuclease VII large subunit [Alphaproteobacteria bacterium]|nr:exodeoxyribonuclease VII large subunit [Alphaproteobacteria bacterium]
MTDFDFGDLFTPQNEKLTPEPKSITQISNEIKRFVEGNFGHVIVKGEIFGAKRADSGHWYLSLKDTGAVLAAVCWRGVASNLKVKIEDGLEVIAQGKITTFSGKSSYQLVIESLEPAGQGALLKLLEERKQQFIKEGLFEAAHKKPIPFLPETIGVVSSATGAVILDIIHRIRDRFPSHIVLWPTPVQGEGAAEKVAEAIRGFNRLNKTSPVKRPDVIIVARGGGSLEDLWAFNEEVVIRAVYDSEIPIISAVGHETDTMLIDYVSDLRAPTPTGAAEFAVPVKNELVTDVNILESRMKNALWRYFEENKTKIDGLSRGIPNMRQIINENLQDLDYRVERLQNAIKNELSQKQNALEKAALKPIYLKSILERYTERLNGLSARLQGVSVEAVLKRGFAWVKNTEGQTIYSAVSAKKEDSLIIKFADNELQAKVTSDTTPNIAPKSVKKIKKEEKTQTSLFDF